MRLVTKVNAYQYKAYAIRKGKGKLISTGVVIADDLLGALKQVLPVARRENKAKRKLGFVMWKVTHKYFLGIRYSETRRYFGAIDEPTKLLKKLQKTNTEG